MLFTILKNIKFRGRLEITNYKGVVYNFGSGDDISRIRLTSKSIENKIFRNPGMYLGEGYMNKEIIIEEGNLDDFLKIVTQSYFDYMDNNKVTKLYQSMYNFFKPFQQINKLTLKESKMQKVLIIT